MPTADARGMALLDLIVALAVASVALAATTAYSVPMIHRESVHSTAYDVQTLLHLARTEAVSRNQECRLVVDTQSGTLQVWDGNGTSALSDDALIRSRRLPRAVAFAGPLGQPAVTLAPIAGTDSFQTTFDQNGTVAAGAGSVRLHGGGRYNEVIVTGAGSVHVQHWSGTGWRSGS